MKALLIAGYVCAFVALVFFPPAFGLLAIIIGIVILSKGKVSHGIAVIVLALACGLVCIYMGWNNLLFEVLGLYRPPQSPAASAVGRPTAQDWYIVSIEVTCSRKTQPRKTGVLP